MRTHDPQKISKNWLKPKPSGPTFGNEKTELGQKKHRGEEGGREMVGCCVGGKGTDASNQNWP